MTQHVAMMAIGSSMPFNLLRVFSNVFLIFFMETKQLSNIEQLGRDRNSIKLDPNRRYLEYFRMLKNAENVCNAFCGI